MFCIKCGFKNEDGARFCGKCGAPLIYDDVFDPDETTHARASGGRRYGEDTSWSRWTAGGQNDDILESQRPDVDQTYGNDIRDSRRADRNRRYGEAEADDYIYTSPASGKIQKNSAKKKKRTKEKEENSTIRIVLACLITLAFVAVAGIMLYQVFSRKDSAPDIAPIEDTVSSDRNGSPDNPTQQSAETGAGQENEQPQAPYMEIYDDEEGVIIVDGQSVPAMTVDEPGASSGTANVSSEVNTSPAAAENDTSNTAVNMEPVEQADQGAKVSQQGSTQAAQQAPVTASLLPGQTGPDLTGYQQVNVVNASASSTIMQTKRDNYPMLLFDGRDDSTWQEGVEGYGIGEWVSWNMDRKYNIKYIGFKMGNWSSDYYYYGNARPKTIVLTAGDFTGQITFTNERAVQWVELSNEVAADSMRIQINDVFPGTTWQDTCITEILVYGK